MKILRSKDDMMMLWDLRNFLAATILVALNVVGMDVPFRTISSGDAVIYYRQNSINTYEVVNLHGTTNVFGCDEMVRYRQSLENQGWVDSNPYRPYQVIPVVHYIDQKEVEARFQNFVTYRANMLKKQAEAREEIVLMKEMAQTLSNYSYNDRTEFVSGYLNHHGTWTHAYYRSE